MNQKRTKFYNTEAKLQNALIMLLEEKEFEDIEISELCAEAKINRSTFYAHYENLYELLTSTNEKVMSTYFEEYIATTYKDHEQDEFYFVFSEKYILPFLEFMRAHKRIMRTYLNNEKTFNLASVYAQNLQTNYPTIFKRFGITDINMINYICLYYLTGMNAIVKEWLKNDCPEDAKYICDIIIRCTNNLDSAKFKEAFNVK